MARQLPHLTRRLTGPPAGGLAEVVSPETEPETEPACGCVTRTSGLDLAP
jgi:hypothetical protein